MHPWPGLLARVSGPSCLAGAMLEQKKTLCNRDRPDVCDADPLQRRNVVLTSKWGCFREVPFANVLSRADLTDCGDGGVFYDAGGRLRPTA